MSLRNTIVGVSYPIAVALCGYAAHKNGGVLEVAIAWLVAIVICSQIAIDLGEFSSAESKAWFSAGYRLLSGVLVVGGAYLLAASRVSA